MVVRPEPTEGRPWSRLTVQPHAAPRRTTRRRHDRRRRTPPPAPRGGGRGPRAAAWRCCWRSRPWSRAPPAPACSCSPAPATTTTTHHDRDPGRATTAASETHRRHGASTPARSTPTPAAGVVDITSRGVTSSSGGALALRRPGPVRIDGAPAPASSSTARATSSRPPTSSTAPRRSRVKFQDGTTRTAKLLGKDNATDVAVLSVDPSGLTLHPLALGSSAVAGRRRPAGRDRRSVHLRAQPEHGHRLRPGPDDQRAQRLHRRARDPDRRGAEPRQLRRPGARRRAARSSASSTRSPPTAPRTPAPASASPSRSTSSGPSCPSSRRARPSATPTSA